MLNNTCFQLVKCDDINIIYPIYQFGWSDDYIAMKEAELQAVFLGDNYDDARYEVTDSNGNITYLIFRAGQSFHRVPDQLFNSESGILLVNSAGNLYRYDVLNNKSLDNSCYSLIDMAEIFNDSPCYFASKSLASANIMVVVDDEGVATINDSKILWKRNFEWAYADYIKILSVSSTEIQIEDESPILEYGEKVSLCTLTGEIKD